jgi:VWFA-related protein
MTESGYPGYLSPASSGDSLNRSSVRFLGILILTIFSPFHVVAQEVVDIVRVDIDLVTVNVSVRDGKGRAMPGLKSDNFLVTDQGEAVSLASLASDGPASIVFVVDISSSMKGIWKSLLKGMKTFLDQSPKENDYSLIIFNEQPKLLVESVSSVVLTRTLNDLRPGGETALYDGLLEGLKVMRRAPQRRKALVLISDGQDTGSQNTITDVEHAAALGRTTIYGIGIKLKEYCGPALPDFCHGIEVLNALSKATGGISRFPDADSITSDLRQVASDISSQYGLSYYSVNKTPGLRRVQVSVVKAERQPKLRYQQYYFKK